ncbi:MAG: type I restriction-modification system, DNA specificity (S) subunit [Candidatus Malacoplasma girerdii]|nr:MAG: type I restriction-modification system, DNA specificity (S) subunit [Candidatus Malacoplasma girerdii]
MIDNSWKTISKHSERERESTELAECYEVKQLQPFEQIKWSKFKLENVFKVLKIKKFSAIPESEGNIPFISSTTINNGVIKYVDENPIKYKNVISITTNGECFVPFFQTDYCCYSSDVEVIYRENLNKDIALFICTLLELESKKYSYNRKPKNGAVGNTIIKLPVNNQNEIDWQYMEDYVKALRERERESTQVVLKTTLLKFLNLDSSYWIKFPIKQFFNVTRGKRIVFNEDYFANKDEQNIYPVITATSRNNSVDGYYFTFNCNGNCICCGGEAAGMLSTYQMDKCWVMDRSRILSPKFKEFNKYLAMFFITLINTNQYRFSYGRSANPIDIEKILIPLPVNINNQPDWEYIEEYIKSLPYSKYI